MLTNFNDQKVLAIRSIDGKCSNWLNVIPVLRFGFVLCGRECRDAIALRYRRPLIEMPALFDVRVIDTDAESHRRRSVDQVIRSAENEKKSKYLAAVEERRGSCLFPPFLRQFLHHSLM